MKIRHLIVKFNSSAFIDNQDDVYFWSAYQMMKTPHRLFSADDETGSSTLRDISFGLNHQIACMDDGKVYTWGDGTYGELGHGKVNAIDTP